MVRFNINCIPLLALSSLLGLSIAATLDRTAYAQGEAVSIAEQARAVFKKRCVSCHSPSQVRGGLDMSSLEAIMAGSTSGAVVEPGNPGESLIYSLAAHLDTPKMPPNAAKIPERELKAISAWIESLASESQTPKMDARPALKTEATPTQTAPALTDGVVSVEPVPGPLCITAIAESETNIAVSGLHQVILYDRANHTWKGALNFPEGDVFALKFTRDGSRLIAAGGVGGLSGHIVCWDTASLRRVRSMTIEDDVVLAMDVTVDGRTVAVAGPKRNIELFDLETGSHKSVLKKHADWVTSLAFSPDGVLLASGDRFGSVYLWDVQDGVYFGAAESHARMVTALKFSADGYRLWSAGKDGYLRHWDLQLGRSLARVLASEQAIADLAVSDNKLVAISEDRRVSVFDESGQPVATTQLDQLPTRCIALESGKGQLLIGDSQSGLSWYDPAKNRIVHSLALPNRPAATTVARQRPLAVERQLQNVATAVVEKSSAAPASADLRAQAQETMAAAQKTLEQTRENLSELEKKISDLQRLIERLE